MWDTVRPNQSYCLEMARSYHSIWPTVSTFVAVEIAVFMYPATVAAMGPASNGGILGLGLLVIAAGFAWGGFLQNAPKRIDRWILQLPIAAGITYVAVGDVVAQMHHGWWRGF